jgi:hypothetical protein
MAEIPIEKQGANNENIRRGIEVRIEDNLMLTAIPRPCGITAIFLAKTELPSLKRSKAPAIRPFDTIISFGHNSIRNKQFIAPEIKPGNNDKTKSNKIRLEFDFTDS